MLKRYASLVGAASLVLSILVGCDDAPSSHEPSSIATVESTTPLAKEAPTLLGDDQPTGKGIFAPKPYERWLRELGLNDRQNGLARRCLENYRGCVRDAELSYLRAKRELLQQKERSAREIRQAVEAGRITADQARARLRQLEERVGASLRELEARAKSAVANCERAFERCIREFLTREQIARWERLSRGGTTR